MKLAWSKAALADRNAAIDYVALDNPRAAIETDTTIESQADILKEFPNSGRPGRLAGTRELVVSGTPYILAYRVERDQVRILRVLHGAQRWPNAMRAR